VGELGWELYIPSGFATAVFDVLMAAGSEFNIRLVGMQAVNSLRVEAGLRHWESDIGPEDTPYEAGLGFGVRLDKGDFLGREALVQQKKSGLSRKLVMFSLDDTEALLFQNEPIYRDGKQVSQITSGAYGFKIESAVGFGYLSNKDGISEKWVLDGNYEIMVEDRKIPAKVHLRSPYDPNNERPKM
jgi:4-methylaminobutanoate oxidase (formaldehyde-forming)